MAGEKKSGISPVVIKNHDGFEANEANEADIDINKEKEIKKEKEKDKKILCLEASKQPCCASAQKSAPQG